MLFSNSAAADGEDFSVSYRVLKNGSTGTSMADQYFVKPGRATLVGDHYEVTLVVKTEHSLGLFPVTVTEFNGQTPSVSKSTQDNTDLYQFTFTATSLSQRLTGHMSVNIPAIRYDHVYAFDIEFNSNGIPVPGGDQKDNKSATSQNDANNSNASANDNKGDNSNSSNNSGVMTGEQASVESSQESMSIQESRSSVVSEVNKPQVTPKAAIKKDKKDKAANKPLPWWPFALIVGVAVIIGIISEFRFRFGKGRSDE
ncbi:NEAT domain-containing protein [Convivina praedatoris]|uniref:NEAT domain-containing protein n=1 Tax=Convivina praedatoris TaxID=2880963 RepID=UPI00200DDE0B|nr:NEAT domain-containing protein [Convivina sp. LMG 32447]